MIGSWELPCIEHIAALRSWRPARLAGPGLDGELDAVAGLRLSLSARPQ
jgi:hypothetical protein